MIEKEIYLTRDEIDYLLKGIIHWEDIEDRLVLQRNRIEKDNKNNGDNESSYISDVESSYSGKSTRNFRKTAAPYDAFEGNKVYFVLTGVSVITLGVWFYFVFT